MRSSSLWLETKHEPVRCEALPAETDVVVIGGGLTGVRTAYDLARAGKKVVLVEQNQIGSGETGHTTAFLTYGIDASLKDLHSRFGDEMAALAWKSNQQAIDEIEATIKRESTDCGFMRCPAYIYAADEQGEQDLRDEAELAKQFGFPVLLEKRDFVFGSRLVLIIPDQAKFHPLQYLFSLVTSAQKLGAVFCEDVKAVDVKADGQDRLVSTAHGTIRCHEVVVATSVPINNRVEMPSRLESTQSYVVEFETKPHSLEQAIYWDTNDPYYYFRFDEEDGFARLILGGVDHPTGEEANPEMRYEQLREYARRHFADLAFKEARRWTGQILTSIDGLPYIGASLADRQSYVAGGYAGNGMTFSHVAARLITDLITDQPNECAELYAPKRFKGASKFSKIGGKYISHMVTDRLRPTEGEAETLKAGTGGLRMYKGKRAAAYRTEKGELVALSPVCTHLGCIVAWNQAEKTWDCPCHGSRFNTNGQPINGPAVKPLDHLE